MKYIETLMLEGAMKIERESGIGHVRDFDSSIFAQPIRHSFNVDFEGDTLHYMGMERQARLTNRQKLRRVFNNASMKKKNGIRKLRKELKAAFPKVAGIMVNNMTPLHKRQLSTFAKAQVAVDKLL